MSTTPWLWTRFQKSMKDCDTVDNFYENTECQEFSPKYAYICIIVSPSEYSFFVKNILIVKALSTIWVDIWKEEMY